jgi:hypothetical protein
MDTSERSIDAKDDNHADKTVSSIAASQEQCNRNQITNGRCWLP